jgi:peptidoglycan hydrolase-like protein with peptidoglycan-binding domain
MVLRSSLFKGNVRLEAAAHSAPWLRYGETGYPIALFQTGLLQLGYKLPISTRKKKGHADGILGDETFAAIKKFQSDHKLKPDGFAGNKTMRALDALLPAAKPVLPKPLPPAPKPTPKPKPAPGPTPPTPTPAPPGPAPTPPMPTSTKFKIGTDDPPIKPDKGAGVWDSESTSLKSRFIKHMIVEDFRFQAAAWVAIGDDATKHLLHYFGNSGDPYTIDLEGMLADVARARKVFHAEIRDMADYVELLPPGTWQITSQHVTQNTDTYNYKGESKNWFFAIGGYSVWGKGRATVDAAGNFALDYEYHFFDRYNWDGGKKVEIAGITITDEWMGQFHREGVAQEFNCIGTVKRSLRWSRAAPLDANAVPPPP